MKVIGQGINRATAARVNSGLDLVSLRFVNGAFQAVTKAHGQCEIRADFPRVLYVAVVGLGCEVARGWRAGGQEISGFIEREVGSQFGKAADRRRACVSDFDRREQRLPLVFVTREAVGIQIRLERRRNVGSSIQIERRVRFREIERGGITHTLVIDFANVHAKLKIVLSLYPREIIGDVVDRRNPRQGMGFAVRLEDEPEIRIIAGAVTTRGESLASETVAEAVDQVVTDSPSVAGR